MNTSSHIDSDKMTELVARMTRIPAHNPRRYETTDGFEDPKCTNGDRAAMAAESLAGFQKSCGMTSEEVDIVAADLVCDLLHLVHAHHCNPLEVLQSGIRHFLSEAGEVTVSHP